MAYITQHIAEPKANITQVVEDAYHDRLKAAPRVLRQLSGTRAQFQGQSGQYASSRNIWLMSDADDFHYARVSSKSITLGVPRLKEIVNVATNIKTSLLAFLDSKRLSILRPTSKHPPYPSMLNARSPEMQRWLWLKSKRSQQHVAGCSHL
jgi:hypothetical protein